MRLLHFLDKYHKDKDFFFWPDLASSHYAKSVIDFLKLKQISFVSKEDNPANVPGCRPIEDFWSILKGQVYKNNWTVSTLDMLENIIQMCLKKLDRKFIQNLISSVPNRLKEAHQNGVQEKQ